MAGGDGMSGTGGTSTVPSSAEVGNSGDGTAVGATVVSTVDVCTELVSDVSDVVELVVVSLSAASLPHAVNNDATAIPEPERTGLIWTRCVKSRSHGYPRPQPLNRPAQPRETFPALRQEVHTLTRFLLPPGLLTARTVWMFGSQRRLVRRWECDTDLPKPGPFPQISHTAAICRTPRISTWGSGFPPRPAAGRPDNLTRIPAGAGITKMVPTGANVLEGAVSRSG
jgi:hypothetical protein